MGECDFCLLWNVILWGDKVTINYAHSCLSWLTCYLEEWHSILVKIWIHQRWEHDGRQLQTCTATLWKKGAGKIKLKPDWSSQTKIHSYKSKVTASGLGAPLVIKHLSQEEPRVAQHDQWYWSMVSTYCNNVAGDYLGHASMSLAGLDEYPLPDPTRTLILLPEPDPNYFSNFPSLGFFLAGCLPAGRFKSFNNDPPILLDSSCLNINPLLVK